MASENRKLRFASDIQPILSNRCYTCHGPDENTREAGLRLDQFDTATAAGDSGETAITPGSTQHSEIYRRITTNDLSIKMPPAETGSQLTQDEINKIATWITQGAEYEEHWAFTPPRPPRITSNVLSSWTRNTIDHFVAEKLVELGKTPSPEASKETLIRRVSYDLTGLPPSISEVDTYLADHRPGAYNRMVDQYLHSPRYGEHLAKYWLDLARYADSNGYQYDTERQQWAWRDWVIYAYNLNMPFDEFTTNQLAGDLLPNATDLQRLATGFNRNHGITIEGGIIDEEYRIEYVMDRVVTTSAVWLGMTLGCARCHDHKYDPVSQKEFYQFFSLFNQVPERGMRGFDPRATLHSPFTDPSISALEKQVESLENQLSNPLDLSPLISKWIEQINAKSPTRWEIISPADFHSSGGSTLTKLDDESILVSGKNPQHDIYTITGVTEKTNLTAVRLEALTHPSLPGAGPGRHSNSNFVLSEFELLATSIRDPKISQRIPLAKAVADYSQSGYGIEKTIDGTTANNSGWAVDGPTRKQPATAIWIAKKPFGFDGGTRLTFTLKHQANFATHGVGRPRLSITSETNTPYDFHGLPEQILALTEKPFNQLDGESQKALESFYLASHNPRSELQERIKKLRNQINQKVPATMIMSELAKPRETKILKRGQYDQPTETVEGGVPSCLNQDTNTSVRNRLEFAKWLTSKSHPLTARVVVNRHWQRLFGRGLVETSEDFGIQGDLPSHPELLDWLAIQLISSDWDIKTLQRSILTSATYRQSSIAPQSEYQADPENKWLARGARYRLDGEQIRDTALAVSGLLAFEVGGKSVYPYQPKGLWMELNNRPGYSQPYPQGSGSELARRSIYSFWKRTVPSPMLKTLDAPEREFCTVRRSRTNTPMQALLILNGKQFIEASQFLAARMMLECDGSVEEKITYGFRLATSRIPTREELSILVEEYNFTDHKIDVALTHQEFGKLSPMLESLPIDVTQLRSYTNVARIILNLDETVSKG